MTTFALLAALLAGTPTQKPAVDCAREVADAHRLYEDRAAEHRAFADPLARAVRHVLERTLSDEDRAAIRGFKQGTVSAGELDARLWPRLRRVFARFNGADCRSLGGVASSQELVDAVSAIRDGTGLHTGVVVTCARRIPGVESRAHLALRVRADDDGPTLVLAGVIERPRSLAWPAGRATEVRRLAVQVPLGDRASELDALAQAMSGDAGEESDFSWIVPAACRKRATVGLASP